MSTVIILIVGLVAVILGVALAYLPLRLLMNSMASKIAAPIREFIARQRDRRKVQRDASDRRDEGRKTPEPSLPAPGTASGPAQHSGSKAP